jgi:hypothetical protein
MAGPLIYPANLQFIGGAIETTFGTPAAAPTWWWPVKSPKHQPHVTALDDDAYQGNMARLQARVPGVRYDTIDYQTFPFLDSVFPHFRNIYGGADTLTGGADPYTHKTSLLNTGNAQPTSLTLWLWNGVECWQMPGCQLGQLDLQTSVAASLANLTAAWVGMPAAKITIPTNTPTTQKPMPAWNTILTVGGVASAGNYSDIKVTFKRDTSAVFGASGAQGPYVVFCGNLAVNGDYTAVYQGYGATIPDLANYITNVQPSVMVQVAPSGDAVHYLNWLATSCSYDTDGVVVSESGKWMEINAKFEAEASPTDVVGANGGLSNGQFKLLNAVSTAY